MEKNNKGTTNANNKSKAGSVVDSSKKTTSTAVFDCHSHIHLERKKIEPFLLKCVEERDKKSYKSFYYEGIVLCSMEENEWGVIQNLRNSFPNLVIPAYGVHPWQAHCCFNSRKSNNTNAQKNSTHGHDNENHVTELPLMKAGWDERLEKQLRAHPEAIVGEIGIDKASRTSYGVNEFDLQVQVFEKQMEIAAKLQRPVTVHCVRAQGYLFDYFRNNFTKGKKNNNNNGANELKIMPPAVMLHSFGGKSDMIRSLLALKDISDRFYFSYSTVINSSNMDTLRSNVAATPDDKLLVESDWDSPAPSREGMEEIVELVAQVKNWSIQQVLGTTSQNAKKFFAAAKLVKESNNNTVLLYPPDPLNLRRI